MDNASVHHIGQAVSLIEEIGTIPLRYHANGGMFFEGQKHILEHATQSFKFWMKTKWMILY